jgi:hypothetical protein
LKLFFISFLISFLGSIPLGSLNLTALKIYKNKNLTSLILFCFIAAIIEFFYSYIAVELENKLPKTKILDLISIFVFLFLAILNWNQKQNEKKISFGNIIFSAFSLSIFNAAVITFWLILAHEIKNWGVEIEPIFLFSFGVSFGTFFSILSFVILISKILDKVNFQKLNKLISILFFLLFFYSILNYLRK